jgi:2-octaprenyl-6-methoxyphenol hydroxylase
MEKKYDVLMVGGGIVGMSLASLLAESSLKVALLDASLPFKREPSSRNDRMLVLAHSSQVILDSMKIWREISQAVTPIRKVHISDKGHFGSSQITAEEERVPFLGYVVSAQKLLAVLQVSINNNPLIDVFQPVKFKSVDYGKNTLLVVAESDSTDLQLTGRLLVAADGQDSAVRNFLNIKNISHDYQQVAITCQVDLKRPHQCVAYERFTEQGPLAFLPLSNQQAAVIWTVSSRQANQLLALEKKNFLKLLQTSFGYRLGKLTDCSQPIPVSLQLVTVRQQVFPRTVLLGNAVHTLHPVAGQGLNLAFRDMAVLGEIISLAVKENKDIGCIEILERYLKQRESDQQQIIALTHSLVSLFSNSLLPVVLARGFSMVMLDRMEWIKKILAKRMLGLGGNVPRLACGLPINE